MICLVLNSVKKLLISFVGVFLACSCAGVPDDAPRLPRDGEKLKKFLEEIILKEGLDRIDTYVLGRKNITIGSMMLSWAQVSVGEMKEVIDLAKDKLRVALCWYQQYPTFERQYAKSDPRYETSGRQIMTEMLYGIYNDGQDRPDARLPEAPLPANASSGKILSVFIRFKSPNAKIEQPYKNPKYVSYCDFQDPYIFEID